MEWKVNYTYAKDGKLRSGSILIEAKNINEAEKTAYAKLDELHGERKWRLSTIKKW